MSLELSADDKPKMRPNRIRAKLPYVDPYGVATGYEDVFTKLEQATQHYEAVGLGKDYVKRLLR
jgi:hypothetical protein